ncbi:MAG: hypothetical protein PHY05_03875 [Methanothrix sp.]|nr:hypothetical protein [Methanothrix sp.]
MDLDKLERDVKQEGNRIVRVKYKKRYLSVELYREGSSSWARPPGGPVPRASGRC